MDLTEALDVAQHPARHEMPTLWAALRVLAPIAERAQDIESRAEELMARDPLPGEDITGTAKLTVQYLLHGNAPRVSPAPDTEEA